MVNFRLKNLPVSVARIGGDKMDNKSEVIVLNEEQKNKFKKLRRSSALKMAGISAKFSFTLFLSNFTVLIIDKLYVHNPAFSTVGIALNFLLSFRSYRLSIQKEHDRIKLEVKNILEN